MFLDFLALIGISSWSVYGHYPSRVLECCDYFWFCFCKNLITRKISWWYSYWTSNNVLLILRLNRLQKPTSFSSFLFLKSSLSYCLVGFLQLETCVLLRIIFIGFSIESYVTSIGIICQREAHLYDYHVYWGWFCLHEKYSIIKMISVVQTRLPFLAKSYCDYIFPCLLSLYITLKSSLRKLPFSLYLVWRTRK